MTYYQSKNSNLIFFMTVNSSITADGLFPFFMESNVKSFSLRIFIVDLRYMSHLFVIEIFPPKSIGIYILLIIHITFYRFQAENKIETLDLQRSHVYF